MYRTVFMPGSHVVLCGTDDRESYAEPDVFGSFTTGNEAVEWLLAHLGGEWVGPCRAGKTGEEHEVVPLQFPTREGHGEQDDIDGEVAVR